MTMDEQANMNRFFSSATPVVAGLLALVFIPSIASATAEMDACILKVIETARDSTTIGEIKESCRRGEPLAPAQTLADAGSAPVYERSVIEERFQAEQAIEKRPFVITPHNPNYLLATTNSDPNQAPFEDLTGLNEPIDDNEMKFQVSIKAPVWRSMFGSNLDAYFAYTAASWWQLGNDDVSNPFRETNYEPELFIRSFTNYEPLGMNIAGWSVGINHQSNGRAEPLSRSWNRLMGRVGLGFTDNLSLLVRAWARLEEDDADDNNPHMHRYFGYGDLRAIWTPNKNTFTAMLRPGTQETSYEVTWSYPISRIFRVYAQYYSGFGESLLDYDFDNERFGIGIAMNDYLMRQ